jgi:tryptophan aminotransferase
MYKGFQTVLSPGDPVLLETPLYAGALPAIRMLGAELVGKSTQRFSVIISSCRAEVDVDEQGLSAINLERVLASWPEGKKRPRVI